MVRFGIIGTNKITEELIAAARQAEDFALTAVYSRTADRATEFAAMHGISHTFTDLEKMASSAELDAVYIASPNSLHAEQAILCMKGGKHVLCEKPIASNTAELEAMIRTARDNGVLLMEAMKSTLLPNFAAIRSNLHKIGPVRRYFASYCQYSSRYDAYKQGTVLNAFNPALSNGSLMDIGVYCLYPLVALFGKPSRVQANGIMLESGVDGQGSMLLSYEEMDGMVMYSKITSSYAPSEIQGEGGTMIIDKINQPEQVHIRYRDGSVEELTQSQAARNMIYEVEEFIRLLHSGQRESAVNSHANSLTTMEIMDEARRQLGLVFPADRKIL
ncbi:Gfo/Idh/MocA family oxidoreductase [Paenibacillus doosanensis]|uniref:1,5-anhydro-D-fructose reductase n=1 Tax=Paenibacillus konkukensis TaxID=2020716 RepID=A0ABY4RWH8_9BACL|nr:MULTISPECIES: Gfo/Idh/MocA family oxidoreductase [Paenibacillus]MCS7461050.1 Gfo/Idh/MocA family oxidoreductase [Paenibacillus doosanensis]UQZ85724.1 1,5-anhydro-D-fructose reductase [Paenibacillus konkukensis]